MTLQPLRQNVELSFTEIRLLTNALALLTVPRDRMTHTDIEAMHGLHQKLFDATERMREQDNSVPWSDPDQPKLV